MPETAGGYTHWCLLGLTSHMFSRLSMMSTDASYTHWCLLDLTSHMFPRPSLMSIDVSMNQYRPSFPNNIIIGVPTDQHDYY